MDLLIPTLPTLLQELTDEIIKSAGIQLYIKRDDLIHPTVSGNKWRKLKYNLEDAKTKKASTLLTFGGAFSNHLYATAAAGYALGFKTIGIVRGENNAEKLTPTLQFCIEQNMQLQYVSRQEYRERNDQEYLKKISLQFDNPYLIPEGGTTSLAIKGVQEMTVEVEVQLGKKPDFYAVAVGTGGTAAGILSEGNNLLAFSALKGGGFLEDDIKNLLPDKKKAGTLKLFTDYHFGGYAKWTPELITFIKEFKINHHIQLEQVYTAKMFYGLYDLIKQGYFAKNAVVVAVHTGGLQGILGELKGS